MNRSCLVLPFQPFATLTALLAATFILAAGCSKNTSSTAPSKPDRDAMGQTAVVAECINLWSSGQQDAAVKKFLTIDWNDPSCFAKPGSLSHSESTFKTLSEGERAQVMKEAASLKALGARVKEIGAKARSGGDATKAGQCARCLQECGAALDQPERLLILQLIGKAFKKFTV